MRFGFVGVCLEACRWIKGSVPHNFPPFSVIFFTIQLCICIISFYGSMSIQDKQVITCMFVR